MVLLKGLHSRRGFAECFLDLCLTCSCTSIFRVCLKMLILIGAYVSPKLLHVSKQGFKTQKLSGLQVSNRVPVKYKADKPML